MSVVTAAWRGGYENRPGWWIQFSYSEATIEALKASVPAFDRTWDDEGKRWWVAELWQDKLAELLPSFVAFRDQPTLF